jgi:acyl-CoA reductase-like NAD-dependent aldehyde dehydrogenase
MKYINNWINGLEVKPESNLYLNKYNPHNNEIISLFANSQKEDVIASISAAQNSYYEWKKLTPIKRGELLFRIVDLMKSNFDSLIKCFATETGKSLNDATGELNGAIRVGEFFASEGMRLYGKTMTSSVYNKQSMTLREPRGVAALIVPANTPIANICWKVFPALVCGNTVVLKSSEDAPEIALEFAKLTKQAGIPDGVLNVIHGTGLNAGQPLIENDKIKTISFTGSTIVGKIIANTVSKRLARLSLELGGKNPFVVCNDADINNAVNWASLSAFSNAGQRCAAASRFIVFEDIYETFVNQFIEKAKKLKLGIDNNSDLGPLISKKQQTYIKNLVDKTIFEGGRLLCGGNIPIDEELAKGNYFYPTLIDNVPLDSEISNTELFGPVAIIYSVKNLEEALTISNNTIYGLTSSIHTKDINKAMFFSKNVIAGVANVNMGTFGSEPHMPFGGFGESGNGSREPGTEALDVYSELKNVSILLNDLSI